MTANGCKHEQASNTTSPQYKNKLSTHLLMFVVIGRLFLKKYKNIVKKPEAFFKMKSEKENGTLTQLPNLHPSSKHEPDPNCEQCQGTGWIIYPIGHFKELGSKLKYDGHDTTFCACTFFTDDVKELAISMISKTVSKLQP